MIAAALRTAPGKPRASCSRRSYGFRLARRPASVMAQAISACRSQRSMSWRWIALIAVNRFEPLMVARPSRACRPGTGNAGPPQRLRSRQQFARYQACPSPIIRSAICDIGARSPQAPTEPFWQTYGVTPRLSISTSVRVISGRQPELPCACTLIRPAIAPRTYSSGAGSPMPAAWL